MKSNVSFRDTNKSCHSFNYLGTRCSPLLRHKIANTNANRITTEEHGCWINMLSPQLGRLFLCHGFSSVSPVFLVATAAATAELQNTVFFPCDGILIRKLLRHWLPRRVGNILFTHQMEISIFLTLLFSSLLFSLPLFSSFSLLLFPLPYSVSSSLFYM